jgi:hypothetical protein
MDKTLMSIQINLIDDVLLNSIISNKQLIGEILFVNENPAKIEMVKVMKVNSVVSKVKEQITYNLKNHTTSFDLIFDNPTKESIINLLINKFNIFYLSSLSADGNEETIPYYIKGIKRLFKKKDVNILIENIGSYCSWIITSDKIIKELSKSKEFIKVNDDSNPKLVGTIKNINVFSINEIEDDLILTGSIDSTTCIFLDNVYINQKSNIYNISVDYLFINKGIRKLILV